MPAIMVGTATRAAYAARRLVTSLSPMVIIARLTWMAVVTVSAEVLELGLDSVQYREVAVDHRVHQGVEHIAGAVSQELRLALGAGPYAEEALLAALAHGEDVVAADEDVDLAGFKLLAHEFHGLQ